MRLNRIGVSLVLAAAAMLAVEAAVRYYAQSAANAANFHSDFLRAGGFHAFSVAQAAEYGLLTRDKKELEKVASTLHTADDAELLAIAFYDENGDLLAVRQWSDEAVVPVRSKPCKEFAAVLTGGHAGVEHYEFRVPVQVSRGMLGGAGDDVARAAAGAAGTETAMVVAVRCYAHVLARTAEDQRQMILLSAVVFVVFLGLALVLVVRRIARPIQRLTEGTNRVAAGHLDTRVDVGRRRDELGELARSFNRMTEDLQHTTVSRDYVDSIIETMGDALIVLGPDGLIRTVNRAACDLLGYTPQDLTGQPADTVLDLCDDRCEVAASSVNKESRLRAHDGRLVDVLLSYSAMKDDAGRHAGIVYTARDITARKQAEEHIRLSEQRFRDVADNTSEWIWEIDADGRYTYSSPAVERILGYTPDEVLARHWYDLVHPEGREQLMRQFQALLAAGQPFRELVNRNVHKDGHDVWLSTSGVPLLGADGKVVGYRGADTDITERRRAQEALEEANRHLKELATTDELTGLWNRRRFTEILALELERAKRRHAPLALVMFDVDQFKPINDTYGHMMGDRVLKEAAKTLQGGARATDIVARYGGDEFMVIMPDATAEEVVSAAERVRKQMSTRQISDGARTVRVNLSAGISAFDPARPVTVDSLVRAADEALYAAKHSGRDCTRTAGQVAETDVARGAVTAQAVAGLRQQVADLSCRLRETFVQDVRSLVQVQEARDPFAKTHSENVARFAAGIAQSLRLDADQVAVVHRAALLHDIGKIGVPDGILWKPGHLTPEERIVMQQHVLIGVKILDRVRLLDREVPIIRHHHERWGGHGYPDGISGEAIPLGARILAVADAFDAITSDRPYRQARPVVEALKILQEDAGRQFDPNVVDALVQAARDMAKADGIPADLMAADLLRQCAAAPV